MAKEDYYATLGIGRDAPAEDIAIRSFERANREPNET